jgi:hypothetical protein
MEKRLSDLIILIEQDLTSNSTSLVPSVAAVSGALATISSQLAAGDTNAVFIHTSDGNVGLGTNSPSQKLEVTGNVKATAFLGDGAQLTNLPHDSSKADLVNGVVPASELPFSPNQLAAIYKANNPASNNVFVTRDDPAWHLQNGNSNLYFNDVSNFSTGYNANYNIVYQACSSIQIAQDSQFNTIAPNSRNISIWNDCVGNYIGYGCSGVTLSSGCVRVETYNCVNFTVPANTSDARYVSNQLVANLSGTSNSGSNSLTADQQGAIMYAKLPTANNVFVTAADVSTKADLVNGKVPISQLLTRDPYAIQDNSSVVAAVTGGVYTKGELQVSSTNYATATGMLVSAGDRIVSTNFVHEYCRLAGGTLGWVRWAKN